MDRLKGALIPQLTEARRAAIVNASKRTAEAEETAKKLQLILKEKAETEKDLQKRVELSRQRKQLSKDLVVTLQKLGEAKTKLETVSKRANTLEARIQTLRSETDDFELKYQFIREVVLAEAKIQNAKKQHNEMIIELDHLGIN
ncbi:hypothetical protein CVT25_013757 [Psilocybe cyanescens]|uniref:Uncharacterized protein n=1 Tax=Psilocybe cyanescens TaxID=93625 RepID=A0A409XLA3_PSICY|nr:hypothetical protein CVT25_013757 [Psilocybe cyanescens]